MKVKLKADTSGKGWFAKKGQEVELPRVTAFGLVQSGYATEVPVAVVPVAPKVEEKAAEVKPAKKTWSKTW